MAAKTRTRRGAAAAEQRSTGVDATADSNGLDESDPLYQLSAAGDGDYISVNRTYPPGHDGWLGDIPVPPTGIGDIPRQLKELYGGGRFKVQVKKRDATGRTKFARGCTVLTIAGEPKAAAVPENASAPITPVVMQAPMPQQDTMAPQVLGILQDALTRSSNGSTQDLAGVVSAISQLLPKQQQQQAHNPASSLDETLGMFVKFQNLFAGQAPPEVVESEDDTGLGGLMSSGGMIEKLIMAKVLGGEQGGPMGGPQMPPPQQAPAPPPPSPQHMWHPQARCWVFPSQMPQAQPAQTVPPPSPNPAPPPSSVPPQPAAAEVVEQEPQEPFTAAEMAEELAAMDEAGQMEFIQIVMARVDPKMAAAVASQMGGNPDGVAPVIDLHDEQPPPSGEGA